MFVLIRRNATTFLRVFRTLVLFFVFFCWFDRQFFCITRDCNYGTTHFVSLIVTGSTGMYGGMEEAPELTPMLAKKEPEVDTSGSSYDTPDQRSS